MAYDCIFIDDRDLSDEQRKCLNSLCDQLKISRYHYDNIVEREWFENINFCGCGDSEGVRAWMKTLLEKLAEDGTFARDVIHEMFESDPECAKYFTLYTLDAMGLTEHGSSVWGSWITDKGRAFIKIMDSYEGVLKSMSALEQAREELSDVLDAMCAWAPPKTPLERLRSALGDFWYVCRVALGEALMDLTLAVMPDGPERRNFADGVEQYDDWKGAE